MIRIIDSGGHTKAMGILGVALMLEIYLQPTLRCPKKWPLQALVEVYNKHSLSVPLVFSLHDQWRHYFVLVWSFSWSADSCYQSSFCIIEIVSVLPAVHKDSWRCQCGVTSGPYAAYLHDVEIVHAQDAHQLGV